MVQPLAPISDPLHSTSPTGDSAKLAAVAVTPMAMGTALDALNAPQSLTARRSAASNLPAFELPPPPLAQYNTTTGQKYPPLPANPTAHPASAVSVGNLLTPPTNSNSDTASPSTNLNNNASSQPNSVLPYTPTSYWPTGTTPYNTGFTPTWQQGSNQFFPTRSMFSPSLGSLVRNTTSPTNGDNQSLPPPPFDLPGSNVLRPFQSSNGPPPNQLQQPSPSQPGLSTVGLSPQNNLPHPTQSPPNSANDAMSQRSASTPVLYGGSQPSSTPQQANFPYPGPSPIMQHPHSASAPPSSRISPVGVSPINNQSQNHFVRPPYPSYSLPAMPGPVMTNVHSPGNPMQVVGNLPPGMMPQFSSGYAANSQNMYNQPQHQGQPAVPDDRPFKCDQCPQSFNRNHDLKRHKRIHLSVKPFPCKDCDKSFSRKDALKVCECA